MSYAIGQKVELVNGKVVSPEELRKLLSTNVKFLYEK